ncbi:hypothetical protein J2TS4_17630 [Paenibacillus sp. J2TS4]|nr:hypothetical protein J2TS4_17630 [Paenibacillus sp. J2TS4]
MTSYPIYFEIKIEDCFQKLLQDIEVGLFSEQTGQEWKKSADLLTPKTYNRD